MLPFHVVADEGVVSQLVDGYSLSSFKGICQFGRKVDLLREAL